MNSSGQTMNATLPSATGGTHRSYNHAPLQNVVFFWTAQRAERLTWRASGSQYWDLINGVSNAPIRSESIETKAKKRGPDNGAQGDKARPRGKNAKG